ncbi:MAG TPA: hypothetical protein VHX59_03455 [Mycobacteriales bacterium]|jgi:hypothetical protein|nr:hypothetical protein [Mycobacteriales bacterium]
MSTDPATPDESLERSGIDAAVEEAAGAQTLAWPAVAAGVVYSWIVGSFPSFTLASNIAVFATGTAVLLVAFVRPPRRHPRGRPVTWAAVGWWVLVLGAFTAVELINLFLGSTHPHPTLSILMAPVLENHLAKSVAVFIWLRVGWVLLHR